MKSGEVFVWTVEPFIPKIEISQEGDTYKSDIKRKFGSLLVQSLPIECTITINQLGIKEQEKTMDRWKADKIPTGTYAIEFNWKNVSLSENVEIKSKLNTEVFVNFIKKEVDITMEKDQETESYYKDDNIDRMVFVQGGTFQMGSTNGGSDEKPVHTVTIDDFYIGKYEVTQKEWKEIMGNNPSNFKGDNLPVEQVSWYDVVDFCNIKSEAEGLTRCYSGSGENITCNFNANGYRLPTEAEWEYSARGGNKSKGYNKYSGSNNIDNVAWYKDNSSSQTHPVGQKKPNELGIYDISGNVWEWCWDWFDSNYYSKSSTRNPTGTSCGTSRVLRGGGRRNKAGNCRVAKRGDDDPAYSCNHYGFRFSRLVESR